MGREESHFICAVCYVYAAYLTLKLTLTLIRKRSLLMAPQLSVDGQNETVTCFNRKVLSNTEEQEVIKTTHLVSSIQDFLLSTNRCPNSEFRSWASMHVRRLEPL